MGVFKPPIGTTTPLSSNTLALNGKSEDQLSVASAVNATNADKLDNLDASDFATIGDIPTNYGDVTGPEGATAGNFPILDVTGKILSDSNYTPYDFATVAHTHTSYVATSNYEDLDVLNKIKNVDGYGSGLDADLWQGYTPNTITVKNAFNATKLDDEYSYVYKNTVKFDQITNEPPASYYTGTTVMVGLTASGGFTGYDFGTVLRYNGTSWDVIGNV